MASTTESRFPSIPSTTPTQDDELLPEGVHATPPAASYPIWQVEEVVAADSLDKNVVKIVKAKLINLLDKTHCEKVLRFKTFRRIAHSGHYWKKFYERYRVIQDRKELTPDEASLRRLRKAETVLSRRTSRILLVLEKCYDSMNHQAVIRTAECLGIQHIWTVLPVEWKNADKVRDDFINKSHASDDDNEDSEDEEHGSDAAGMDIEPSPSPSTTASDSAPTTCARARRKARRRQQNARMYTKVTRGNERWLSIRNFETTKQCIEALRADGREIWVTDLSQASESLEQPGFTLPPRVAIVIGRETDGTSPEMLAAADKRIYLPIHGFTESLNLSVASALILQRLFFICPEARGDLSETEKRELRVRWYAELCRKKKPGIKEAMMRLVDNPPPPLTDLRMEEKDRAAAWVKPKIKNRIKAKEEEVQQRVESARSPVSTVSVTTPPPTTPP